MKNKEAIILAGGLGTRLSSVLEKTPKSIAPVRGRPFLVYLLENLIRYNFTSAILATGYRHIDIMAFFGDTYKGMKLLYSVEEEPLGTGGAILKALSMVTGDTCVVLNGDTLFSIDLEEFEDFYYRNEPDLSVALKPMRNFERYGNLTMEGNRIISFEEKRYCKSGLINGGIYLLKKDWVVKHAPGEKFSFERDIMEKRASGDLITGYVSDAYFIDIGIPEDYARAADELPDPGH
jgi:D-glycero-alpha-D-manno-heptose 1-phosphate guanylyltransferase